MGPGANQEWKWVVGGGEARGRGGIFSPGPIKAGGSQVYMDLFPCSMVNSFKNNTILVFSAAPNILVFSQISNLWIKKIFWGVGMCFGVEVMLLFPAGRMMTEVFCIIKYSGSLKGRK